MSLERWTLIGHDSMICKDQEYVKNYSSTSLVRGFWDEIFWPSKPRTTEKPRTKEGHI